MRSSKNPIRRALVAGAVLAATLVVAAPPGVEAQTNGCPSVGSNFASSGPFDVTVESASNHTYYSPENLGSQGCDTHPVILWGNGTFLSPSSYSAYLNHLASHGFIVAAANTSNAGSGAQMLDGLDNLTSFNGDSSSRYYQRVDLDNVGATGHSQGGGGSINAGKDSRVDVVFPLQPWSQNQNNLDAASIFFAGGSDNIVSASSVHNRYESVQNRLPAAYAELSGAGHLVVLGNASGYRGPSTAWARWLLMGDADAAAEFVGSNCGLCTANNWDYEKNTLLDNLDPGDPGNGDPGDPGDCVSATNSQHLGAGRATRSFLIYSAVGSGDSLGILSSSTTSVEETSAGYWERVNSC